MLTKPLPNLEKPSVILMNNAPYQSALLKKPVTTYYIGRGIIPTKSRQYICQSAKGAMKKLYSSLHDF
jgi:hypothetical protein